MSPTTTATIAHPPTIDARYYTDATIFTEPTYPAAEDSMTERTYGKSAGRFRTVNVMRWAEGEWGEQFEANLGGTSEGTQYAIKGITDDTLVLTLFDSELDPSKSAGSQRWDEADYRGRITALTDSSGGPRAVGLEWVKEGPKYRWETRWERIPGDLHRRIKAHPTLSAWEKFILLNLR